MGPLKRGKCFKWNYGNDVIIVWAGLMSLAAAAILNALHLRKTPPVPLQKDQKKLLELLLWCWMHHMGLYTLPKYLLNFGHSGPLWVWQLWCFSINTGMGSGRVNFEWVNK